MNPLCGKPGRRSSHDTESMVSCCGCEHQRTGNMTRGERPGGVSGGCSGGATAACCPPPTPHLVRVCICPTTGGNFHVDLDNNASVDSLRKAIGKKLKLPTERISLLYRETLLTAGTVRDNHLVDGAKVTLLPNVETGLMSPRPDTTVMQALDGLSDSQVNDFLAGRSPLTLAMRVGNHMMFVQLQLSTTPPGVKKPAPVMSRMATGPTAPPRECPTGSYTSHTQAPPPPRTLEVQRNSSCSSNHSNSRPAAPCIAKPTPVAPCPLGVHPGGAVAPSAGPPRQLPTQPYLCPTSSALQVPRSPPGGATAPAIAVTGCAPSSPMPGQVVPGFTAATPAGPEGAGGLTTPSGLTLTPTAMTGGRTPSPPTMTTPTTAAIAPDVGVSSSSPPTSAPASPTLPFLDASTLAEARRRLSLKLREFSDQATTHITEDDDAAQKPKGAVIESMQHLGQGVYSGTFSGTLNPALQDKQGRPRRSINTIIHILNDLLTARSHGPRQCLNGGLGGGGATLPQQPQQPPQPQQQTPRGGSPPHPHPHTPLQRYPHQEQQQQQQQQHQQQQQRQRQRQHPQTVTCPPRAPHPAVLQPQALRVPSQTAATATHSASAETEKEAIRGKVEALQGRLEERRRRRQARRGGARGSPYQRASPGPRRAPTTTTTPVHSDRTVRDNNECDMDDCSSAS